MEPSSLKTTRSGIDGSSSAEGRAAAAAAGEVRFGGTASRAACCTRDSEGDGGAAECDGSGCLGGTASRAACCTEASEVEGGTKHGGSVTPRVGQGPLWPTEKDSCGADSSRGGTSPLETHAAKAAPALSASGAEPGWLRQPSPNCHLGTMVPAFDAGSWWSLHEPPRGHLPLMKKTMQGFWSPRLPISSSTRSHSAFHTSRE